jgi:hypothetical protein
MGIKSLYGNTVTGFCLIDKNRGTNAPALARRRAIGLAIVAFVSDRRARRDFGTYVEQSRELGAVARLTAVRMNAMGNPSKSVLRWIFVEKPPCERPRD